MRESAARVSCAFTLMLCLRFTGFIANVGLLVLFCPFSDPNLPAGEGVPDWPYYPVLAKFLEGRTEFGDSYDAGSHSYTEPEARPGASHHHPGKVSLT